jgi:hypothetical protein
MRPSIAAIPFAAMSLAVAFAMLDATPVYAQSRGQIAGKTCPQIYRSCFRICARHKGEPDWRNCESDCNDGLRSCRTTGTWVSKNATITPPPAPPKRRWWRRKS